MKNLLSTILVSLTLLASSAASAQVISDPLTPIDKQETQASMTEKVTHLLSGYEYFPSRKDLDQVGSEDAILDILEGFVEDKTTRPSLRLRAVDAIGFYSAKRVNLYLRAKIESTSDKDASAVLRRADRRIRAHAVTSYAKAFKKTELSYLESIAQKKDVDLKLSAIYAIAKHCGKEGRVALAKLKKTEKNLAALRAIGKFLK